MFHKLDYSPHCDIAHFASRTLEYNGQTYVVIAGDTPAERLADPVYTEICRVYRKIDLAKAVILWVSPAAFANGRRLVHKIFYNEAFYPIMAIEIEEADISVSGEIEVAVSDCESELLKALQLPPPSALPL
jgi:hypothetical protein